MVNNSDTKVSYQGNGQTTVFPFSFPFIQRDYIKVAIYDSLTDETKTIDSDYYVDTVANAVIYPGYEPGQEPAEALRPPILPATSTITIYRQTDVDQLTDLGEKYPLKDIENMADKLTEIIQEQAETLGRAVKVPVGDPKTPEEKLTDLQNYVKAAADSAADAADSEASAQRSAEAAATSEANAATSERLASGYADTASDAASRAEDSAISARAYNAPEYDNETTYQAGDVVTYTDGNSYRALQETTGNEPPNIIYWQKVTDYVGDDFFEVDEYGYIVPMDSPSHSRYWRIDQNGYIVPIEGGDGGYRPDTRSLSAEYLDVTNEGYVKHLRADDVNAGNLSATGNVTAGMVTTPQANVTTLTANAVNAGTVTANDIIAKGPVVDVRAFGAKGDGVTDDAEAIQAAIDTGYTVVGKDGDVYYCNSNIMGKGNLVNIHLKFGTRFGISYSAANAHNIIIKNCKFEMIGSITDPTDRGNWGIDLNNVINGIVVDCYFYNFTNNIYFENAENITIARNVFEHSFESAIGGNGYGVCFATSKNVKIIDNTFIDIQRHSVYVALDSEREVVNESVIISGNYFTTPNRPAQGIITEFEYPVKVMGGENVIINDNVFDNNFGAILLDDITLKEHSSVMDNIIISSNTIRNCYSRADRGLIHTLGGLKNGGGYSIKHIIISDNIFNCFNATELTATCVVLGAIEDCNIVNNTMITAQNVVNNDSLVRVLCGYVSTGLFAHSIKIVNNMCSNAMVFYVDNTNGYSYGIINNLLIHNNTSHFYNEYTHVVDVTYVNKINMLEIKNNAMLGMSRGIKIVTTEKGEIIIDGNTAINEKKYQLNSAWSSGKIYVSHNLNLDKYDTYPNLEFVTNW